MSEAGPGLAVVSGTRLTDRIGIGVLTRLIDRDLVDEVLGETGRVEQRCRLLPARVVVYYVLALCLFFGDAYEEVMRLLVAGLLFTGAWQKDWQVPTTGAIAQARPKPLLDAQTMARRPLIPRSTVSLPLMSGVF